MPIFLSIYSHLQAWRLESKTIFCKTKVFAAFHCTAGCRVWIRLTFLMSLWCYNKMLTKSHIPSKYESFSEKLATKHIYKSSFSLPLSGGEKLAKCKIHVNAAKATRTSMHEISFSSWLLPACCNYFQFTGSCFKHRKNCECCHHHSLFKGHNVIVQHQRGLVSTFTKTV